MSRFASRIFAALDIPKAIDWTSAGGLKTANSSFFEIQVTDPLIQQA